MKNNSAFYVFPKLDVKKFHITNDKQFASDLLHATNILIVPGSGFDWQEPDHFRIVMLPEAEVLGDAVKRIGNFLNYISTIRNLRYSFYVYHFENCANSTKISHDFCEIV